jgi:hypothetical protein
MSINIAAECVKNIYSILFQIVGFEEKEVKIYLLLCMTVKLYLLH